MARLGPWCPKCGGQMIRKRHTEGKVLKRGKWVPAERYFDWYCVVCKIFWVRWNVTPDAEESPEVHQPLEPVVATIRRSPQR